MAPTLEDLKYILPTQVNLQGRKLQIVLLGTIIGLVVLCLVLGTLVGLHAGGQIAPAGGSSGFLPITSSACVTRECLETAARISENLDTSVDPCTNFHRYACGSWPKRHSIPPDRPDYTVKRKLSDQNEERLRELLETPVKRDTPTSTERKLKEFFRKCLHDYGRMRDAGADLLALIKQQLKGWYVLNPDTWSNNGWNLNDAISKVQGDLNVDVLLRMSVALDWRSKKGMISLSRGGTGMYYSYYLRDDKEGIQDAYKDYMRAVGSLLIRDANITLDGGEEAHRVEQFVNDAYGQEEHLAQLVMRSRNNRKTYRVKTLTLGVIETNFTQLPWREIIQEAFEGFDVTADTKVRIWPYGYFQLVDELLRNETTDKDRIMNNYMVWQIASEYVQYLSWEYKYAGYRYYEKAYGSKEFPESWTQCMTLARRTLGSALAAEFLKKHSSVEKKTMVEQMYNFTKRALYDSIERFHWMDNATKSLAEEKVASVRSTVAFPESYFDQTFLDDLHSRLIVNKNDSFFKTYVNVQNFQRYMRTLEMKAGASYYMWRFVLSGGSGGTAPMYFWRNNYLLVPPGSLQVPIFEQANPSFMNFGGIGRQMAEELSGAINQLGRLLWTNGSYVNWWTEDTYSGYLKAKNCFSNYFEGMKVGPFLIKGKNVTVVLQGRYLSRRTVDLVSGLRTGLKAYHDWAADNGGDQMPVGLNMSPDQAYFVSAAQTQCYMRTPEASYNYARYSHIPEEQWWNAALNHMKEFADAFSCGTNTKMATNETCNVF